MSADATADVGGAGLGGVRRRVVVATGDTIGPRMAGPAIRAWHLAEVLAAEHEVRLVTTGSAAAVGGAVPAFAVAAVDDAALRSAVEWCDVIVLQGWVLAFRPWLARSTKVVVVDLYDPMHLEQLEQARDAGPVGRLAAVADCTGVLNEQLLRGDAFLCASEKQRDLWLGALAALGRVNPATYDDDPSLRRLIDVVPFGLPSEPPRPAAGGGGGGLRAALPAVGATDPVILWGGGIYNWFDPLTLIRAVADVRAAVPDVRLVFMGTQHPSPEIPAMRMAADAVALAEGLGLLGTTVLFNEGWVPYEERAGFLLQATVGVSTHLDHVETEFSFRTRILDYLWAGLPIVCTAGDGFADLVEAEGLGVTVAAGDVDGLAAALTRAVTDGDWAASCRTRIAEVAPRFTWPAVAEPLVRLCRDARRAPDLLDPAIRRRFGGVPVAPRPRKGVRADVLRAADTLRDDGVAALARRATSRLRRSRRPHQ